MADDDDRPAVEVASTEESHHSFPKRMYKIFCVQTPKAAYLILGNELCERFAYYGMRSVLVLYLKEELKIEAGFSKMFYHMFVFFNYFFSILGGIVADTWTGKFHLIWPGSVVYSFAMTLIAIGSVPTWDVDHLAIVMCGLLLVAVAGGCIKPCIVAFAGDQFAKDKEGARTKFFGIFYFFANVGAALSMIISPLVRTRVKCIKNYETCYPVAFGLPAILMALAVIFFIAGTPLYNRYPAQGSAVVNCIKCIGHAMAMKIKLRKIKPRRAHWMDYADDKYNEETISDVKAVLGIFLILTTLPLFWTLFDQQGSTWTIQSSRMYGMVGSFRITPDIMDSVNAILVMVLIPCMFLIVYPIFAKVGLLKRPLQRMTVGLFLVSLSFIIGGILYVIMEAEYPRYPEEGKTEVVFYNAVPCNLKFTIAGQAPFELKSFSSETLKDIPYGVLDGNVTVSDPTIWPFADLPLLVETSNRGAYGLLIYDTEKSGTRQMNFSKSAESRVRDFKTNKPMVKILRVADKVVNKMLIHRNNKVTTCILLLPNFEQAEYFLLGSDNEEEEFCYGSTTIDPKKCGRTTECTGPVFHKETYWRGGIYTLILIDDSKEKTRAVSIKTGEPDDIHIFWQLPQYFFITLGEVMASVTSFSFAYEEAPQSMKSVCQAALLLTIAMGNLFIILFDGAIQDGVNKNSDTTSNSFFVYAALSFVDACILLYLAWRYKYKNENYNKL